MAMKVPQMISTSTRPRDRSPCFTKLEGHLEIATCHIAHSQNGRASPQRHNAINSLPAGSGLILAPKEPTQQLVPNRASPSYFEWVIDKDSPYTKKGTRLL